MADSDDILGAYLRHRIEAWLREDPSRSAAALARSAGVTPTHISTIRSQSRGVGMKTIRGLAVALGTTLADLESEAAEWARENPQARRPTRTAPTLDRIEGYAAAEAAARAIAPRIPDAAWAKVRAMSGADVRVVDAESVLGFARTWERVLAGQVQPYPDDGDVPPPPRKR